MTACPGIPEHASANISALEGDHYSESTEKILVLGESHYAPPDDDLSDFTGDTVRDYLSPGHKPWKNYFTKVHRVIFKALASTRNIQREREAFWHTVVYYVYIQEILDTQARGNRPSPEMWKAAQGPLFTVLAKWQPCHIIVTGIELWRQFQIGCNIPESEIARVNYMGSDGEEIFAKAASIKHPSAGLCYAEAVPTIEKLFSIS